MNEHHDSKHPATAAPVADQPSEPSAQAHTEQDRRDAIRKIGKYSAYVAPAMMAMFGHKAVAGS